MMMMKIIIREWRKDFFGNPVSTELYLDRFMECLLRAFRNPGKPWDDFSCTKQLNLVASSVMSIMGVNLCLEDSAERAWRRIPPPRLFRNPPPPKPTATGWNRAHLEERHG